MRKSNKPYKKISHCNCEDVYRRIYEMIINIDNTLIKIQNNKYQTKLCNYSI